MKLKLFLALLLAALPGMLRAGEPVAAVPYRVIGNKMIVDFRINGNLYPMIFDTGGQMSITDLVCEQLALPAAEDRLITDANGQSTHYQTIMIDSLSDYGGTFSFARVKSVKMPRQAVECFDAAGIIGSDLLQNHVVEIDAHTRTILIYEPSAAPKLPLRNALRFAADGFMPIVPVNVAGIRINAIFDSGSGSPLSLKDTDYRMLAGRGVVKVVSEGRSVGSLGLGGLGESGSLKRIEMGRMSLGPAKFDGIVTEVSTPPYTLLGIQFLDYARVVIDYPHRLLYYIPHKNENDMSRAMRDLNLTVKGGELVVAAVFGPMCEVLEIGDRVVRINGRKPPEFDFCESITKGIPELREPEVVLTVKTRRGKMKIDYNNPNPGK